jgi:hypothetical protein
MTKPAFDVFSLNYQVLDRVAEMRGSGVLKEVEHGLSWSDKSGSRKLAV